VNYKNLHTHKAHIFW